MPQVNIIGCGPGRKSLLTGEALDAAHGSEILYGTKRLLDLFKDFSGSKVEIKSNYTMIIDKIELNFQKHRISVLVTGDGGFHSFGSLVRERIGDDNCRFYSGISSIQYAFNRLGISWEDAVFLSHHGEEIPDIRSVVEHNAKIGILTGGEDGVKKLLKGMPRSLFINRRIFLLENLSYDNERIGEITLDEGLEGTPSSLSILIILKKG
jgi:precorrin-6y C5,15-methyltransferase (decarboxylating) CbiE subunit